MYFFYRYKCNELIGNLLSLQQIKKKMRIHFLTFLLFILVAMPLASQPKHEIRATWITTLGGMDWPRQKATNAESIRKQQQELCDILDRLKEAHFNTILFQTRLRGNLIYPSSIETFPESLTGKTGRNSGYDPLAFAIEECHKRGMELHAWIVTIPIGNARQVRLLGKKSIVQKNRKICKQFKGSWYLDPGHPETGDYLSNIVREITSKYDIDGIHFDYIRYPEQGERFPDNDTYRKYGKKKNKKQWRRDNITAIVRRLYQDVKAIKPWVKVSSSPVGKYASTSRYRSKGWDAYHAVYQDAQGWMKEGIHDALFPMMYFQGNDFYPFALDWKENDNDRWVVPGLGIYFLSPNEKDWPIEEIVRQIHFTRLHHLGGQAYFRNRFLLDNIKGIYNEVKTDFYATPALVPPMTWMDSIAPSTPTSPFHEYQNDGSLKLQWGTSTDNNDQPTVYHLYGSTTYPVDTECADHLIETSLRSTQIVLKDWQKNRYFAVTAADRYGNESMPLALNEPTEWDVPLLNKGNQLILPENKKGTTIIICTSTEKEILRTPHASRIDIQTIPSGFYLVYSIDSTYKELIGSILK